MDDQQGSTLTARIAGQRGFYSLVAAAEFLDQTCFDHVVSIGYEADEWQVEVFGEPYGGVRLNHPDPTKLLRFWVALFESQPVDWQFAKAGWHLGLRLPTFEWTEPEHSSKIWLIPDDR